jgi:CheY-like chemotaxis protein
VHPDNRWVQRVEGAGAVQDGNTAAAGAADRIVVVDDDGDTTDTLAEALSLEGFDVRTAHDGASALTTIAAHSPMCVLTDVRMPGIDGFELARRLRATYGAELVLIAATGWGDPDDRAAPQFADFDFCLRKPIDLARLRRILRPG